MLEMGFREVCGKVDGLLYYYSLKLFLHMCNNLLLQPEQGLYCPKWKTSDISTCFSEIFVCFYNFEI